jgi:hypothetical protein
MLAHQGMLFSLMGTAAYGTAGTFLSFIFFSEFTLCLGLNDIVGTFLHVWSSSKKNFRLFFGWNIVINYLFALVYLTATFILVKTIKTFDSLSLGLYLIIATIVLMEKTKRICKTILHITFKSKAKSFIELGSFFMYLILLWTGYALGIPLTPTMLIVPMLISSFCSCIALIVTVWMHHYRYLLDHNSSVEINKDIVVRIIRSRLFAIGHKTSKRFLSENFIVPVFAAAFGAQQAGILKFIKQIATYTTLILRKTVGNASSALFAHTRYDNQQELSAHLRWMTSFLTYSMLALILTACAAVGCFRWYAPKLCTVSLMILIMTSFIHAATMNGITALEYWFTTQEKPMILLKTQGVATAIWLITLTQSAHINPTHLLFIATACNIAVFMYLGIVALCSNRRTDRTASLFNMGSKIN